MFWLTIEPRCVGGSEFNQWILKAIIPGQELTETYNDYLEMMERIHELLLRFRQIEE